jgi:hypothetical protein
VVLSCHHGAARPEVADGGTASNLEGNCEYIELPVADSRQGVVFHHGFGRGANTPHLKKLSCYETFTVASDLD